MVSHDRTIYSSTLINANSDIRLKEIVPEGILLETSPIQETYFSLKRRNTRILLDLGFNNVASYGGGFIRDNQLVFASNERSNGYILSQQYLVTISSTVSDQLCSQLDFSGVLKVTKERSSWSIDRVQLHLEQLKHVRIGRHVYRNLPSYLLIEADAIRDLLSFCTNTFTLDSVHGFGVKDIVDRYSL